MDRFTSPIISYGEQQHINRYLLHAIIINRISFRTVNNKFFHEFSRKKFNPFYELLSRKKLAHEVFSQEVIYAENKNESLLAKAVYLTLNINGWSN